MLEVYEGNFGTVRMIDTQNNEDYQHMYSKKTYVDLVNEGVINEVDLDTTLEEDISAIRTLKKKHRLLTLHLSMNEASLSPALKLIQGVAAGIVMRLKANEKKNMGSMNSEDRQKLILKQSTLVSYLVVLNIYISSNLKKQATKYAGDVKKLLNKM
jgi:hypothetical protein